MSMVHVVLETEINFSTSLSSEMIHSCFLIKVEEAGKVALVDRCSSIIIGFLIQIEIFNEVPSNLAWVGVGVVMMAIIIIGIKKMLKKRKKLSLPDK